MAREFVFFSLAVTGSGISGGDRIFIELARNWSKKDIVNIYTSYQGSELIKKQKLISKNINIEIIPNKLLTKNFIFDYIFKIFFSIYLGITLKKDTDYLYSSSEFLMDVLPSSIIKIRNKKIKWISTWYQTAPNPIKGFSETNREKKYNFKALLYWLSQLPTKPLIKNFSDAIIVNNDSEKKVFPNKKTIVLIGAVPLNDIKAYTKRNRKHKKIYDAVFQGRLHSQKGVVELVKIWKKVVEKNPNAKLAMIGDGDLRKDVENEIRKNGLNKNIKLFGYLFDGNKKFKIFSQSRVVVHPAFYDSGGMAAAEAMAFGLPAIGFDLISYKSYYPKGMLKVEQNNLTAFANAIYKLLNNKKIYNAYSVQAKKLIESNYSWEKRSSQIYNQL